MSIRSVRSPGPRRDIALRVVVISAVCLLLALAIPLALAARMTHAFSGYKQDLAQTFSGGERCRSITCTYQGETTKVPTSRASRLFTLIVDTGMGRPTDEVPDGSWLELDFGDGATLQMWAVGITGAGRQSDTGVLIRYTRANGSVYAYDTDRLQLEDVTRILGLG